MTTLDTVIRFTPQKLLRGILYHLSEEVVIKEWGPVLPETVEDTFRRLKVVRANGSISRSLWAQMTDAQRLVWLLKRARTVVEQENGLLRLIEGQDGKA